ncbi:hypothetical protein HYDPIDRAFT_153053 [Hydnomerulius pinastri MD-312]|uniref:phosphatidylserine decarboxylase n=1 Tax=Hydnomerulius pinastri MD-312 TaxID=994086 RepID=A0A0C9WGB0_9AGAM|nr:hypothetical protein HYDPIDRAFT_153053 [Hydnomerulius pinastri MD-312]
MFLHSSHLTKPVEKIDQQSLPGVESSDVALGLTQVVESTGSEPSGDVTKGIHGAAHSHHFLHGLIPQLQDLANKYHVGNFVIDRKTKNKFFESMPIYARLGMHMLFYGKEQVKLLEGNKHVEDLLREQSIREGQIYDSPESVKNIPSFISTYKLQLDELLEPDIHKYKTFNEFFYRKLKADARPVENAEDPNAFCSAADSRLVVYPNVKEATTVWIKGDEFSIPSLLCLGPNNPMRDEFSPGSSLAIFRLAPSDYHRFHSPADVKVLGTHHDIPGQYYTVNPQAVNEPKLDVFSRNKRSVLLLEHVQSGKRIAYVAIGALLVGSVSWTVENGQTVKRGEELGYFAYGGSTVVVVFPPDLITFDDDLLENSGATGPEGAKKEPVETLMKVGYSLGRWNNPNA